MKKIFLAIAVAVFGLAACNKPGDADTLSANIVLKTTETVVSMPAEFNVKVTSQEGVTVFDKTVAAEGTNVTVNNIISGIYNITVFGATNIGGSTYNFSGSLNAIAITQKDQSIEVELTVSKEAALLFKEIFYVGGSGRFPEGSSQPYRDDNFYEIFNNSNSDAYLDGLCIANVAPTVASEILSWELDGGRKAADYVFCQAIWQFPGTGKDYVLKPGESVVVASVPIDHTKIISGTLDLSSADFEFFVENQNIYADTPTIPNMVLKFGKFGNGADRYLPSVNGPAMILFKPEGNIDNSTFVSPVGKTDQCKEIPVSCVIDGVEAVQKSDMVEFKRLPASIDGGAVYMANSVKYVHPLIGMEMTSWDHTGISFSRKYKNGTDITGGLVDTNNSTEDFVANDTPVIRRGL
ncbi:MAG: DUF4876 domain-containing protein [Bacteroidales bacterium]|nr:DUF4876 domain-containing protein [Bacteroidales bacterium]